MVVGANDAEGGRLKQLYVKDITPDLQGIICDWFLLTSKETKLTRGGKPYLNLRLSDKTGDIECKLWDADTIPADVGAAVKIEATAGEYNGKPQLTVNRLRLPIETERPQLDPGFFYPASEHDRDEMYGRILSTIENYTTGDIQRLLRAIFNDPEIAPLFHEAAAASSIHHAYIGGLAEHSLSLAEAGRMMAYHYSLDESLMIAGALLHDIGKLYELALNTRAVTRQGALLGHIAMGYKLVTWYCHKLRIDPKTAEMVEHMILSHHGTKEWGSPVLPAFKEALVFHNLDQIDAKLAAVDAAMKAPSDESEEFTAWIKATGSRFLRDTTRAVPTEEPKFDTIPTDA